MKIASWNVNGLRTRIVEINNYTIIDGNSLAKLISVENPDIICFQETRCSVENAKKFKNNNYPFQYYNESKGLNARGPNRYSGTAIWSVVEPISVEYQIPNYNDTEGRIIIMSFPNKKIINVYTPNSGTNFENRLLWNKAFLEYLSTLTENVVFCGDMNVAYRPQDTHFDQKKIKPVAGILPEEIEFITQLKGINYEDSYNSNGFTWWNPMCKKENGMSIMRNRDLGWRLDYFFVKGIDIIESKILKFIGEEHAGKSPLSSDHAPILLEYLSSSKRI